MAQLIFEHQRERNHEGDAGRDEPLGKVTPPHQHVNVRCEGYNAVVPDGSPKSDLVAAPIRAHEQVPRIPYLRPSNEVQSNENGGVNRMVVGPVQEAIPEIVKHGYSLFEVLFTNGYIIISYFSIFYNIYLSKIALGGLKPLKPFASAFVYAPTS